MTPNKAKVLIRSFLQENNVPFSRLSAKTVHFSDLARASCIFVKVHGWVANPIAGDIVSLAKENGFCVEFTSLTK